MERRISVAKIVEKILGGQKVFINILIFAKARRKAKNVIFLRKNLVDIPSLLKLLRLK